MSKNKTKNQSAKATLAEVTKEMAKPRVARSAREHSHILRDEELSREEMLRSEFGTVQSARCNEYTTPATVTDIDNAIG